MTSARSPRVVGVWLMLAAAVAAGCAHAAGTTSRPLPFPGSAPPIASPPRSRTASSEILKRALALRGASYRLGGDRPEAGFDCSGLVRYVFREMRVEVPRTVAEQFGSGAKIRASDVAPGDLIFFTTTGRGPSHVGIALDQSSFIHAPGVGSVVRVEHFDTPYWRSRFSGVRRVVDP